MKKFLTIAAVTTAVAMSSLAVYAQGMGYGGCGGEGMGPGIGMGFPFMMEKELNLTDDQMDKIHKADMEFRESQYQNMLNHRKAIDKILTDDQKKKLDDLRKNGPDRSWKKNGKGKHMGQDQRKGPAFDLSDEQIDKIHKINTDYADKFHKNRKNADELKKLRESRDKEIEKVLTKEQLEKMKEFRKNAGRDCPYFPDGE